MDQKQYEELVRLVTDQVVRILSRGGGCPAEEGREKVLAAGDPALVPPELAEGRVVCPLEDYKTHRNILRYSRVVITDLTLTELSDIALGRDAGVKQCAVLQALLQGVDVFLREEGLPFKTWSGRGSKVLHSLLSGYVQTLRTFGVKPAKQWKPEPVPEARPPKFQAPAVEVPAGTARPNAQRLVTEDGARALVKSGGPVALARDAIVTPAAWDVLRAAGVEIVKE